MNQGFLLWSASMDAGEILSSQKPTMKKMEKN
jgi:hypothetical protein